MRQTNIAAIILAAGSSSRMGSAKINLPMRGTTLLEHCIQQASIADLSPIIVIKGAHEMKQDSALQIDVVLNPRWESGIGSSIKIGFLHVRDKFPETEAIMILVADQPFVNALHLTKLAESFSHDQKLTASYYAKAPGVPALFPLTYMDQILSISDHHGAKAILEKNRAVINLIDFPEGETDIDTPEDYDKLLNS